MNNWYLLVVFAIFMALPSVLMLYPLKQHRRKASLILLPCLMIFAGLGYHQWGSWPVWQHYVAEQRMQQEIKRVLAQIKSPDELIERLKSRLDETPASARGWYLLGRLYISQNAWQKAKDAFAKACQLNPADEAAKINYIEAQWQLHDQQFDASLRRDLQDVLHKNPNQPDALALLAMDAYQSNNYPDAIQFWQHLLRMAPENSPESKSLRKAIAKAQQKLQQKQS